MKKELSLYVHIPFCVKKCYYCDFLSAPASEEVREYYVNKLCEEIEKEAVFYSEYRIKTVFFGGGTPTALTAEQLERILCKVKESFSIDGKGDFYKEGEEKILPEITLECNPGTVDEGALHILYQAGFNRLSIGLQSANQKELKILGRIHDWKDFQNTYHAARKIGFHNINVDIMSALPGQSVESYQETLQKALALRPEHISAYSLMIEEDTPFYRKYAEADRQRRREGADQAHLLPTEEEERRMYELTEEMLKQYGYYRYEISNYALPGKECQHNIVYWQRGNYLGLGLGAASMIENVRFTKTKDLNEYLMDRDKTNAGTPLAGNKEGSTDGYFDIQHLTLSEQMEEFMFLGLRLTEGISCRRFQEHFHADIMDVYGDVIKKLEEQHLLLTEGDRIFLTKAGVDVSNVILAEFLLD